MKMVAESIPGYTYGTSVVAVSPVSLGELDDLKKTVGFTDEDHRCLHTAGDVLAGQTRQLVEHWRGILAGLAHLVRHVRTPEGEPILEYSASSGLRFQQWIMDTCQKPYDQDWLNYQHEIALRHTALKKNRTDGVRSTPYVPLRDIIAFVAVMNETVKPYLAAKGHSEPEVDAMHRAWCKSLQLQVALWARPYAESTMAANEW